MSENIGVIYKVLSPSGKIYVGQTKNLKHRLYCYKTLRCKTQPKLYNSIQKYGWDAHVFEIIDQCSIELNKDELDNKEKHWIAFYDSHHNGLNCNDGGQGHLGRKQSPEHIAKRVVALKKKGRGLGKKLSEETKQKLSDSHLGISFKQSEEHIAKRVAKNKGKKRTPEQIERHKAGQKRRHENKNKQ